jgi:diguanylate cyclase (GGDEF)-like protein/PAS domain S-box-containing protein
MTCCPSGEQAVVERLKGELAHATAVIAEAYRGTTGLIRLLEAIGRPQPPDALVDDTLTVLSDVFGCAVTCLLRPAGDRLLVTNSCGLPEQSPAFVEGWDLSHAPERTVRGGHSTRVPIGSEAVQLPEELRGLGIRNVVWVPLTRGPEPEDLLLLCRRGTPFEDSDLPVLESMGYRLRLALQEGERSLVIERLAQVGHRMAQHLDESPLMAEAARLFRLVTSAQGAWSITVADSMARLRAVAGRSIYVGGRWPRPVVELVGWDDLRHGEVMNCTAQAVDQGQVAGSLLAVPVLHGGEVVAVLYAVHSRSRLFTQDTVDISTLFASYLKVALTNAELYRALGHSEEYLRLITDSISDLIAVVDGEGRCTYVSPSHSRELSYGPADLLGRSLLDLVHPQETELVRTALKTCGAREPTRTAEYRLLTGENRWAWLESALRPVPGRDTTYVISSRVIDERRKLQDELLRRATHDPLTGLANRVLARQVLDRALDGPGQSQVGVLFCDLDKFKDVNDRLGHETGDELLVQVSRRLSTCMAPGHLLARFGGDEFVVVVDGVTDRSRMTELAYRMLSALRAPFRLAGDRVQVSASIGGVLGTRGMSVAVDLLRDADAAMYAAKDDGGSQLEIFDAAASRRSLDRLSLRSALQQALELGQLSVEYQPVVRLDNGIITGFEALLRWRHPERGPVSAEVFIPLAEETGAIIELGEWVLRQACRQLRQWNGMRPDRRLGISVNLSTRQLRVPGIAKTLLGIVHAEGVDPSDLWLEITERGKVPDEAAAIMERLRSEGVRFALDDFGMSHSNLSHLRQLPVERLKIDRSFVAGLTEGTVDRGIVNGILVIAQSLGLDVVAEGVERCEQREELLSLGCEQAQGNLLSVPLSAHHATRLLRSGVPLDLSARFPEPEGRVIDGQVAAVGGSPIAGHSTPLKPASPH